jgi:hypothetical protein
VTQGGVEVVQDSELSKNDRPLWVTVEAFDLAVFEFEHVTARDVHMLTRRQSLTLSTGVLWLSLRPPGADAQSAGPVQLPDPALFKSGDLVWPKKPRVYVPYISGRPADPATDEANWLKERNEFIEEVSRKAPYLAAPAIDRMRNLTFGEFYAEYVGGQEPDTPGVYPRGDGLYVGHVGIVEVESQTPWVIEALYEQGVVRHRYTDWLAGRPGEIVWLGRVADYPEAERAKIAIEAKTQLGKPYNFWNLDLSDTAEFYCSKLAWWAILKSLNLAIDGDPNPKRWFWFSPKQLLYDDRITRLFEPCSYGTC